MFCICFTPSLDIVGIILVDIIHRFYGEDLESSELVSKKIILLKFKSCNDEDDDDEDEDDDYVSAKLKVPILECTSHNRLFFDCSWRMIFLNFCRFLGVLCRMIMLSRIFQSGLTH